MIDRGKELAAIERALDDAIHLKHPSGVVCQGDALELLQKMPDSSVSLILTDPPYHTTKKANIFGDTAFEEDGHYVEWMQKIALQWKRVLRPNGSLYCFCASDMAARLEVMLSKDFNILSHIVWTKPNDPGFDGWKQKMRKTSLRQWYAHSERILFAEKACEGNLFRSSFGTFLRNVRKLSGLSSKALAELTGQYGKINHGGAICNWEDGRNVPSRQQYQLVSEAILKVGKIDYMPPYEDLFRAFKVDSSIEFSDVWTFPSVRPFRGKHPAEKPREMLEHAIEASTYPGDIVLDCFGGSGSTALAANHVNRKFVSIEIQEKWVLSACRYLSAFTANNGNGHRKRSSEISPMRNDRSNGRSLQVSLALE